MNKRLLMVLFSIMLIGILAACGGDSDDAEGTDDADTGADSAETEATDDGDKDVYTVATANDFVPFESIDEETDELVGFDIDLVSALADEVGIEIEFETLDFDGIVAGIGSGRFDIAIAGMGITEERKESIDFTQPYYESGLVLAVKEGNEEIKSIDDVEGKTVASRTGSTSQEYLEANTEAEIEAFPGIIEAYQNVLAGRSDAVLYDQPNVQFYAKSEADNKLVIVGERLTGEEYGIAFPKGSELRDDMDDALTTIKENGTYDDIYEEWFGERPEGN